MKNKLLLTFLTLLLPATYIGSINSKVYNADAFFDYSDNSNITTIKASDLLEQVTGTLISDTEKNYVDSFNTYDVKYTNNINKNNVEVALLDNVLYVAAHDFTYNDGNLDHKWIPDTLKYNSKVYYFTKEEDKYLAKITNYNQFVTSFNISYKTSLVLPKENLNNLLNLAYNKGQETYNLVQENKQMKLQYDDVCRKREQYLLDLEEYNRKLAEYNTYDSIMTDYQLRYDNYVNELQEYNELVRLNQEYAQYQLDMIEYNKKLDEYLIYANKKAIWDLNHPANQKAYDEYNESVDTVNRILKYMELPYHDFYLLGTDMQRSLIYSLTSGTVDSVLSQKEALGQLQAPSDIIDQAAEATSLLKTLLLSYAEKEGNEAKYLYYQSNWQNLFYSSYMLFLCLEKLYRCGSVAATIENQGKTKQYNLLIAQLAYFSNLLKLGDTKLTNYEGCDINSFRRTRVRLITNLNAKDAQLVDENWRFNGLTWSQYLQGFEMMDITKSGEPTATYYSTPVELIPPPTPVIEDPRPNKPATQTEPEPIPEKMPSPPTKPDIPVVTKPDPIPFVEEPTAPIYHNISEDDLTLGTAYENHLLTQREILNDDYIMELTDSTTINFYTHLSNIAIFHDTNNDILKYKFFNNGIEYIGRTPIKDPDIFFTDYDFDYWMDNENNPIDLSTLDSSIELYPHFVGSNPQKYNVTWNLADGKTIQTVSNAGTIPSCPEYPTKSSTRDHYYEFDRWDKEIIPITHDETYTAIFNEYNHYEITFNIDGHQSSQYVKEGEMPIVPIDTSKPDTDRHYYTFDKWDPVVTPANSHVTYTALFDEYNYYYATFVVNGESSTIKYKEGEIISYNGLVPSKDSTDSTYYIWKGWNGFVDQPIHQDCEIHPVFDEHHFYNVTFKTHDAEQTFKIKDEDMPVAPEVPGYNDLTFEYEFIGWDKSIEKPTCDIVYNAVYKANPIYVDLSNNIVTLTQNDEMAVFTISSNEKSFNISNLSKHFDSISSPSIQIHFNEDVIIFTKSQMKALLMKNIQTIGYTLIDNGHNSYNLSIDAVDENGQIIDAEAIGKINVAINGTFDSEHSITMLEDKRVTASFDNNIFSSLIYLNKVYSIIPIYDINCETAPEYKITSSSKKATFGTKVSISYELDNGYNLLQLKVTTKSGKIIPVENNTFDMPDEDVFIVAEIEHIIYYIDFIVDGVLYERIEAYYGQKITAPSAVFKESDEDFIYSFNSWDKSIDTVTQNEEINAIFDKTPIPKIEQVESPIFKPILIISIIIACFLLLILFIIILKVFKLK